MSDSETKSLRLIRRPEVERLTGLSTSKIYSMLSDKPGEADPEFPKPIPLGSCRSIAWVQGEVLDWIQKQIARRGTRVKFVPARRPRAVPVLRTDALEAEDA